MAEKKSTVKTLRLSEDVCDYINSQPGDNFTDKFLRLIDEVRHGEEKRLSRIRSLDDCIEMKNRNLEQIIKDLRALDEINRNLSYISTSVQRLAAVTKRHVIQNVPGQPAAADKL